MKNTETERKFLVRKEIWTTAKRPPAVYYRQGYLCIDPDKVIRARVAGSKGFLTIKGKSETLSHPEFEYEIPASEAEELIRLFTNNSIVKTRTKIPVGKHIWEVDEFMGDNDGLIIAEIELESQDEGFEKPDWVGEEVTSDRRYYNSSLSLFPFRSWK